MRLHGINANKVTSAGLLVGRSAGKCSLWQKASGEAHLLFAIYMKRIAQYALAQVRNSFASGAVVVTYLWWWLPLK